MIFCKKKVCFKELVFFFSIRPTFFKRAKIGQKIFLFACCLYRQIRYCMSYPEMALNVNIYYCQMVHHRLENHWPELPHHGVIPVIANRHSKNLFLTNLKLFFRNKTKIGSQLMLNPIKIKKKILKKVFRIMFFLNTPKK